MAKKTVTGTVNLGGVKITSYSDGSQTRETTSSSKANSNSKTSSNTGVKTSSGYIGTADSAVKNGNGTTTTKTYTPSSSSSGSYTTTTTPTVNSSVGTVKAAVVNDKAVTLPTYTIGTSNGNTWYNLAKANGQSQFQDKDGSTVTLKADANGNVTATKNGVTYSVNNTYSASQGNVANSANSSSTGNYYKVGADGKAPSYAKTGDYIVTGGGTYQIDANGKGVLVDKNQTTSNFSNYTAAPSQVVKNTSNIITLADGTSFDENKDYTTAINEAVANGDYGTAARLEAERNAKIAYGKEKGYSYGNYETTSNFSKGATDAEGNKYNVVTDAEGNLTLYNSDWSVATSLANGMGGLITIGNDDVGKTQYIATKKENSVVLTKVIAANTSLCKYDADGALNLASWADEFGNDVDSADLVWCADNLTHNKNTGETIGDMLTRMGDINKGDYLIRVLDNETGEHYYDLDGNRRDGVSLATFTPEIWGLDQQQNMLLDAMLDAGYNNAPKINDYDVLTWEQALAQAKEQLNGQYNAQLDNTLDAMNQKALQTGFYGQLPTEALRQQAAAANEINRESAINDLARSLMSDSQNYAQTLYEDDRQTSQDRQTAVYNIYNMLRNARADELEKSTSQQDYEQKERQLAQDAVQVYVYAASNKVSIKDAMKSLGLTSL